MRVGFVVNPIAGMGGTVALKGTDGGEILESAISRGAEKTAPRRALDALRAIRALGLDIDFVTCSGEMGEEELLESGLEHEIVYRPPRKTSPEDTIEAVRRFVSSGIELLVFAGGDGTARDIVSVLDASTPMIGIPSGVKMHSGVFANTPADAAYLLQRYMGSETTREAEVMDVDEESFRRGVVESHLYGVARIPDDQTRVQSGKQAYHSGSADDEASELGQYIAESMREGVIYVIGPGTTTAKVAEAMGTPKTLLGVDAYLNKKLVKLDMTEGEILELLAQRGSAEVIVSPIGAQGFFLGRGNQQISPRVVRAVGSENLTVIATPTKLRFTPTLRVDTGDDELNRTLRRQMKVVTGYRRRKLVSVK